MVQGNAVDAQGVLIRLLQIGFATGSLVSLALLLLQVASGLRFFFLWLLGTALHIHRSLKCSLPVMLVASYDAYTLGGAAACNNAVYPMRLHAIGPV